jgi:Protein of unknown function (DUF1116)
MASGDLLGAPASVSCVGISLLADALAGQGVPVARVAWSPPEPDAEPALARAALAADAIARGNDAAVARMNAAHPLLVGVGTAGELIRGMTRRTFLHAGPPIEWSEMSGPLRGAIVGAALYEGLAVDAVQAARQASSGAFEFVPCHERDAVGPMAGVVSASMPMWIVENSTHGNRAFCTFNEGLGKVLRYGANDEGVLARLRWMREVLAPILSAVVQRLASPIDLRALISQALQMGDEAHNRNRAATSLLLRELLPALLESDARSGDLAAVARFISGNDHFFLNLSMPAAKVTADAARGVPCSSIAVAMARNGTEFGVRLSGTGDRWFTGPSGVVSGLYLPGYSAADANPDIGDSTITETVGLGGLAMAAAPAIVQFVGGRAETALDATLSMYDITWSESAHYQVPALGFRGTPLGIDALEVVHTRRLPLINTGIAHREPGIGQVGAGLVRPPMNAFVDAVRALTEAI